MSCEADSGHRTLPHTADVIIEAWGGDEAGCATQAAQAIIEICVSGEPDLEAGSWVSTVRAARLLDLVEAVLEEVLFVFDTSDLVPVAAFVEPTADSGFELRLALAPRASVGVVGAAPKAIVMLEPASSEDGPPARCRFLVDV